MHWPIQVQEFTYNFEFEAEKCDLDGRTTKIGPTTHDISHTFASNNDNESELSRRPHALPNKPLKLITQFQLHTFGISHKIKTLRIS